MTRPFELATTVTAGAAGALAAVVTLGASLILALPAVLGVAVVTIAAGRRRGY
ncbi:MAG: hypothetical protein WD638_03045 [Nitriliruptoraceae bacterium]